MMLTIRLARRSRRGTARYALMGGAVACLLLHHGVWGQQRGSMCIGTVTPQKGELGYQMRGDTHCEGEYERLVGAPGSLEPVSLVRADRPVPPDFYRLAWPHVHSGGEVSVQAMAFRPRLFYRMDTRRSSGGFDWPTTILRKLNLGATEIGVIATTQVDIDSVKEALYLPVDLDPSAKTAPGSYVLKMASAEDLSEVFLTITGPANGVKPLPTVLQDKSLQRSYSVAPAPLTVPLDLRQQPSGRYRIVVTGKRKNGPGSTSRALYLQHEK
jgi:hypothetical protein